MIAYEIADENRAMAFAAQLHSCAACEVHSHEARPHCLVYCSSLGYLGPAIEPAPAANHRLGSRLGKQCDNDDALVVLGAVAQ